MSTGGKAFDIAVVGATGMVLPSVFRKNPQLAPLAALGICLLMLGATATHIMLGETKEMMVPLCLATMSHWPFWVKFGYNYPVPFAT